MSMCVCVYIYTHTHTHIYIYVYMHIILCHSKRFCYTYATEECQTMGHTMTITYTVYPEHKMYGNLNHRVGSHKEIKVIHGWPQCVQRCVCPYDWPIWSTTSSVKTEQGVGLPYLHWMLHKSQIIIQLLLPWWSDRKKKTGMNINTRSSMRWHISTQSDKD